jgi:hypothetical protein
MTIFSTGYKGIASDIDDKFSRSYLYMQQLLAVSTMQKIGQL